MTKYILHGGNMRESADKGHAFFEETIKGFGNEPKVLWCFFAQPKDKWEEKYEEFKARFIEQLKGSSLDINMATFENFEEELSKSNALVLYGGDNQLLLEALNKYPSFRLALVGKTVAGSSAGAIVLAKKSWACDSRAVVSGMGLVPVNTLVHYGSNYGSDDPRGPIDWKAAEAELQKAIGKDETITKLREGRFVIIEQ